MWYIIKEQEKRINKAKIGDVQINNNHNKQKKINNIRGPMFKRYFGISYLTTKATSEILACNYYTFQF